MKKSEIGLIPVSMGLFSMMMLLVIPGTISLDNDTFVAYGVATITQYDADKNPIFTQSVHNQLLDEGEDFILDQTFKDVGGVATVDASQIGAVCLSSATANTDETRTVSDFNGATGKTTASFTNCLTDSAVTHTGGVATLDGLSYETGVHWHNADTVNSIGVCAAETAPSAACAGTLFATASVGPTTFGADGESVEVTYNFILTSDGS